MNFSEPLHVSQINVNKLTYNKIKDERAKNKKIVYIKYNDNKPLVFQCPSLLCDNTPVKITDDYYELDVPLICMDESKESRLINLFKTLDKKIIEDAKTFGKLWFDENYDTYTLKTVIKDSDKYKNGVLKVKIIKTHNFETLLLMDNKEKISLDKIPNKSWVKILLEAYSIIINTQNKTFYLFLRPIAMSFSEMKKYNYRFLEDSDENDDDVPDSEINNLFLKDKNNNNNNDSIINMVESNVNSSNINNLNLNALSNFNSTSSEDNEASEKSDSGGTDSDMKRILESSDDN